MTDQSSFKKWKDSLDKARDNPRFFELDKTIIDTVNTYNKHLSNTPNYKPLDWKLIKAMILAESTSFETNAWRTRPLQIGNSGDPGLRSLLEGNEGGYLIIPPAWQNGRLTISSALNNQTDNIRAGVGYLLMKAANRDIRRIEDPKGEILETSVTPTLNSAWKIAQAFGTTVDSLKEVNAKKKIYINNLQINQKIYYRKSSMRKVITGWKKIDKNTVYNLYNKNKKSNYSEKIDYAIEIKNKKQ